MSARDEYCRSLEAQLGAWQNNVETLMRISEKLPSKDPASDARQIENLRGIIEGLTNVRDLLKQECVN